MGSNSPSAGAPASSWTTTSPPPVPFWSAAAATGAPVSSSAPGAGEDRLHFFVSGHAVDLDDERDRTDLDSVARLDDRFLYALPVVVRPVGAAEVFQLQSVAVLDQAAVLAGDLAQRDTQVAVLATADDREVFVKRETASIAIRPEHRQDDLHVG